jgi:hypothetical protein
VRPVLLLDAGRGAQEDLIDWLAASPCQSSAAVEAFDPVAAGGGGLHTGVGGVAVRAHLDGQLCGGRADRESRTASCADDVDEMRLGPAPTSPSNGGQQDVQPPSRRRDHARLGRAHLRHRPRPTTHRLHGRTRHALTPGPPHPAHVSSARCASAAAVSRPTRRSSRSPRVRTPSSTRPSYDRAGDLHLRQRRRCPVQRRHAAEYGPQLPLPVRPLYTVGWDRITAAAVDINQAIEHGAFRVGEQAGCHSTASTSKTRPPHTPPSRAEPSERSSSPSQADEQSPDERALERVWREAPRRRRVPEPEGKARAAESGRSSAERRAGGT